MKKVVFLCALTALLVAGCGKNESAPDYCTAQEQRTLPAGDSASLFVPNAFTPDGDGLNEFFGPAGKDIATISFTVFDEKGKQVYHSTELNGHYAAPTPEHHYKRYFFQVQATTLHGHTLAWCGSAYALTCIPDFLHYDQLIFPDQFDPATPYGYLHGVSNEHYRECN